MKARVLPASLSFVALVAFAAGAVLFLASREADHAEALPMTSIYGSAGSMKGRLFATQVDMHRVELPAEGEINAQLDVDEAIFQVTGDVTTQCEGNAGGSLIYVQAHCWTEIHDLVVWAFDRDIVRADRVIVSSDWLSQGGTPAPVYPHFVYEGLCVRYFPGHDQCHPVGAPTFLPEYSQMYPGLQVPINT